MMARPKATGPTERELEILQVLWEQGPSTIREVYQTLNNKSKTAYNSVLTILVIMFGKKLVNRDDSARSHVYQAKYSKAEMETRMVKTFMDNVFGGSAMRLVTKALSLKPTSKEDKELIRFVLERGKGYEESD
jgi:BlaI family transcriptional regulator, penicillinase repressor